VSDLPWVQAHYERCRAEGTGHRLAEMFAFAQPPMSNTDREFMEGRCNGNQFESAPDQGDYYASVAKQHGVNVKGKVYLSGLAAFPGDPRAWVDGRGDAQRLLEERGWASDGAVKVKAAAAEGPPERVTVADDLLDGAVMKELHHDPGLADMDPGELRHEIKQKIKPHWTE
jgi:hypothetical protein